MRCVDALLPLALVVLTAACTGGKGDGEPTHPASRPAVQRELRAGVRVELTAVVSRVYGEHAFVVDDADLPPAGQVVVSAAAVTVFVDDLVTVSGATDRLDRAALRQYGVADPAGVVVIATTVRRYPVPSPTP
ncbi:hypothetical protein [Dactylosporangium sp. NPDC051541]|uniref:hypothetical protein n=1 Tax=Dactylosporangium sp. NPDC051541 TaxID=3363977 RepID=UPI00378DB114